MADEGTPIRAAVTQMQEKIKDLEVNIEALEGRLQWILSPEPIPKMDLKEPVDPVTTDESHLEVLEGKRSKTLLDELVGCINKLEMLKQRIENLLKRLQV